MIVVAKGGDVDGVVVRAVEMEIAFEGVSGSGYGDLIRVNTITAHDC